jgi:predicted acyltransferase
VLAVVAMVAIPMALEEQALQVMTEPLQQQILAALVVVVLAVLVVEVLVVLTVEVLVVAPVAPSEEVAEEGVEQQGLMAL